MSKKTRVPVFDTKASNFQKVQRSLIDNGNSTIIPIMPDKDLPRLTR